MASEYGHSRHGKAGEVAAASGRGNSDGGQTRGEGVEDEEALPRTVVAMVVLLLRSVVVEAATAISGSKRPDSRQCLVGLSTEKLEQRNVLASETAMSKIREILLHLLVWNGGISLK